LAAMSLGGNHWPISFQEPARRLLCPDRNHDRGDSDGPACRGAKPSLLRDIVIRTGRRAGSCCRHRVSHRPTGLHRQQPDRDRDPRGFEINSTVSLRAGVNNLTDEQPPVYAPAIAANTDPSTYDLVGRRYYVGLMARF
jgi:hypothetical protein